MAQGKRTALITGSNKNIGKAIALHLAEAGYNIVVNGSQNRAACEEVAGQVRERGTEALIEICDIGDKEKVQAMANSAIAKFGAVDVLVNNAAVLQVEALEDTSRDDFVRVVMVNQVGSFLGIRAVLDDMKASGGGSIVNISSIDGLEGMNGVVAYASSKWGVRGLTRVAALELGKFGIRVNTVCPGSGSFEMIQPFVEKQIQRFAHAARTAEQRGEPAPSPASSVSHNVLNRKTTVDDIAAVILFLASDEAAACTGGDYAVDAGYTAGKIIPGAPGS